MKEQTFNRNSNSDIHRILKNESKQKVRLLRKAFFLESSKVDLIDMKEFAYQKSLTTSALDKQEVRKAILTVNSKKAVGPSEALFLTLHWALKNPLFTSIIRTLVNACLDDQYCYKRFKRINSSGTQKISQNRIHWVKLRSQSLSNVLAIWQKSMSYSAPYTSAVVKSHSQSMRLT